MPTDEQPLSEFLNRDGEGPVITREWLDALLDRQLPQVLTSLVQKKPVSIPDFVKLTQMERESYPVNDKIRTIIWMDRIEE
jgi:hypothetical protein